MHKSIIGAIDILERKSDGRLHLAGWAFDTQDISKSFDIFLIVPQRLVMISSTGLRRDDVTNHFALAKEAVYPGFDVVFEYQFDCNYNEKGPFVVAVSRTKQFSLIKPWVQVSGCRRDWRADLGVSAQH